VTAILTGAEPAFQSEDGQWSVRTLNSWWDVRRKDGEWAVRRVSGKHPLTPRSSEDWKPAMDVRWWGRGLMFVWNEREGTQTSPVEETMVLGPAVRGW
jgi:hypothetical protein